MAALIRNLTKLNDSTEFIIFSYSNHHELEDLCFHPYYDPLKADVRFFHHFIAFWMNSVQAKLKYTFKVRTSHFSFKMLQSGEKNRIL